MGVYTSYESETHTLGLDRLLVSKLLKHLVGGGQTITTLTNSDVDAELGDLQLPHGLLGLCGCLQRI